MKAKPTLMLCFLSLVVFQAWSQVARWTGYTSIKGLRIPFYSKSQPQAVAFMRVERFYDSYQKKGFFQIGMLPIVVADEVRFEFLQPSEVRTALAEAHHALKSGKFGRCLEIRQASFAFPTNSQVSVKAGKIRLLDGGVWELSAGVQIDAPGCKHVLPKALLQITGDRAGEIKWASVEGPASLNIFGHDRGSTKADLP